MPQHHASLTAHEKLKLKMWLCDILSFGMVLEFNGSDELFSASTAFFTFLYVSLTHKGDGFSKRMRKALGCTKIGHYRLIHSDDNKTDEGGSNFVSTSKQK